MDTTEKQIADILADAQRAADAEGEHERRQHLQQVEIACWALAGQTGLADAGPCGVGIPKEPSPELLRSMAMRFRHDFDIDADSDDGAIAVGLTEREREYVLDIMRKLYREVSGHGNFKWSA